jgi:hypothetical protein
VLLAFGFLALVLPARPARVDAATGSWSGSYYNNKTLAGPAALTRDDGPALNFFWTGSPGPGVVANPFSVRWSRTDM